MDKWKKKLDGVLHKDRNTHDGQHQQHQQPQFGDGGGQHSQQHPFGGDVGQAGNPNAGPVEPRVKGRPQILGLAGDPGLNRDSGGSAHFGDRIFWTWRDTNFCMPDGSVCEFPMMSSTASWSDLDEQGRPQIKAVQGDPMRCNVLQQYGTNPSDQSYYKQLRHICEPPGGMCKDGSRVALWPDQPPLVTSTPGDQHVVAYTWVKRAHMDGAMQPLTKHPPTILYRSDYDTRKAKDHRGDLPKITVVDEDFWKKNEIAFGHYGNVTKDGIAYLYAQVGEHGCIALARCPADKVEKRSKYEYWVNGGWTSDMPTPDTRGIEIKDASAGGQGTYFWNRHWGCFVWIGGTIFPGAKCYIATAPQPQGPWTQAKDFWEGPVGTHPISAYSIQAHPALVQNSGKNDMYLTYTTQGDCYRSPLVYVEFE